MLYGVATYCGLLGCVPASRASQGGDRWIGQTLREHPSSAAQWAPDKGIQVHCSCGHHCHWNVAAWYMPYIEATQKQGFAAKITNTNKSSTDCRSHFALNLYRVYDWLIDIWSRHIKIHQNSEMGFSDIQIVLAESCPWLNVRTCARNRRFAAYDFQVYRRCRWIQS